GVLLPPLMTIVILVWIGRTIVYYVLDPVQMGAREVLSRTIADVRRDDELPGARKTADPTIVEFEDQRFKRLPSGQYVRLDGILTVERNLGSEPLPTTGRGLYDRYVEVQYLRPYIVVPIVLIVFLALMYLLGSFLAVGIGRAIWNSLERAFYRLPLVSNV